MIEPSAAEDRAARQVVDAAYAVHSALGPGLLENVYEQCLCHELATRSVALKRQVAQPLVYKGMRLEGGLRLDILVEERVIVEIKAIERLLPVHTAQLLSYLKLSNLRLGFLINFNVPLIRDGIRRLLRPG